MSWNGSGLYSTPPADFPAVSGTLIQALKFNNIVNDIATALNNVLCRDGQAAATGNLPMAGFKLTNVGDGATAQEYTTLKQLQNDVGVWCGTAGGTVDALTLSPSPATTAYVAGQKFVFKTAGANTVAPSVAVSGLAAKSILNDNAPLTAGQLESGKWYRITYDGANFQLEKLALPGTPTIADGSITYAKIQDATQNTLLRRIDGSNGVLSELAVTVNSLVGRASSGSITNITLGSGLQLTGTVLSAPTPTVTSTLDSIIGL